MENGDGVVVISDSSDEEEYDEETNANYRLDLDDDIESDDCMVVEEEPTKVPRKKQRKQVLNCLDDQALEQVDNEPATSMDVDDDCTIVETDTTVLNGESNKVKQTTRVRTDLLGNGQTNTNGDSVMKKLQAAANAVKMPVLQQALKNAHLSVAKSNLNLFESAGFGAEVGQKMTSQALTYFVNSNPEFFKKPRLVMIYPTTLNVPVPVANSSLSNTKNTSNSPISEVVTTPNVKKITTVSKFTIKNPEVINREQTKPDVDCQCKSKPNVQIIPKCNLSLSSANYQASNNFSSVDDQLFIRCPDLQLYSCINNNIYTHYPSFASGFTGFKPNECFNSKRCFDKREYDILKRKHTQLIRKDHYHIRYIKKVENELRKKIYEGHISKYKISSSNAVWIHENNFGASSTYYLSDEHKKKNIFYVNMDQIVTSLYMDYFPLFKEAVQNQRVCIIDVPKNVNKDVNPSKKHPHSEEMKKNRFCDFVANFHLAKTEYKFSHVLHDHNYCYTT